MVKHIIEKLSLRRRKEEEVQNWEQKEQLSDKVLGSVESLS